MENTRNNRDIMLIKTEAWKSYLVSEPSEIQKKNISENLLATKMKRTEVFLVLSIFAISKSKIVMYEKLYDYVKRKYGGKAELCYMNTDDTDGFIVCKTENINVVKDIEVMN